MGKGCRACLSWKLKDGPWEIAFKSLENIITLIDAQLNTIPGASRRHGAATCKTGEQVRVTTPQIRIRHR